MEKHFETLNNCPLFANISKSDLKALLNCLDSKFITTKKNQSIFNAGDKSEYMGIVLEGSVHVIQDDYWGNRNIITIAKSADMFCEAFACTQSTALPVSVLTNEPGSILLVDCNRLLTTCSSTCIFHAQLIRNLMNILANKNIALTRKIAHITKKNTKDKVLSYLCECALLEKKNIFTIPFNRQELADFLSVERSALSNTLSSMRDEGSIDFKKNQFTIFEHCKD